MPPQQRIDTICAALPGVEWSIRIARGREIVAEVAPDRVQRIASLGKILVLIAVAERIAADASFAAAPLARPSAPVADSGLWQHLSMPSMTVADACVLVGSVSDNLATNALIDAIGLDACNAVATRAGCTGFVLHDIVRDVRGPGDAPCLAEGSAADAIRLLDSLDAIPGGRHVLDWLALGVDHSLALAALGADPLSPGAVGEPIHGHKTGSDPGVRADAGRIGSGESAIRYAVIANFDAQTQPSVDVARAMRAMLAPIVAD